jgi:hypothetical protein
MKIVCISLVLITYVCHEAWFKKQSMVITCQTLEFGRATTVLGIIMLGQILTGKTGH